MRGSGYTDEDVIAVVRDLGTGQSASKVSAAHGVSVRTVGVWKRRYGGMSASQIRRVRCLESDLASADRALALVRRDLAFAREIKSWLS